MLLSISWEIGNRFMKKNSFAFLALFDSLGDKRCYFEKKFAVVRSCTQKRLSYNYLNYNKTPSGPQILIALLTTYWKSEKPIIACKWIFFVQRAHLITSFSPTKLLRDEHALYKLNLWEFRSRKEKSYLIQ